jgi:hypothetical protein
MLLSATAIALSFTPSAVGRTLFAIGKQQEKYTRLGKPGNFKRRNITK